MTLLKRLSIALLILGLSTATADDRPPAITTARTIALGGSATALSDDAGTSFWNPSGVPLLQRTELAFSHADRFGMGIQSNYGSFVYPLFERHALGIDFLRESFGDGELSDAFQIFNATYGVRILQSLSLGLSGKWVSQSIDLNGASLRSAGGFGFDLGLLLTPRFEPLDRLRLGITLKDVGGTSVRDENSQVKEEVFKQSWRAGASYRLRDDLMIALDVDDRLYAGAEYQPHATLLLRGGLNRDLSAPAGADKTLTYAMGFGLRWKNARIDYAFENHPVLPATHHLSLSLAYNPAIVGIQDALVRPSPVFKSLYRTYEATEFIDVVLKNSSQESLPVTVSIDIPTLTQTPHEESLVLRPNSTERYGFTLTFPHDLLFAQSARYDNLVQPSVTVRYMQGRSSKTTTRRLNSMYVMGKGKLSWSNPQRIAAFITQESRTVDRFARGVIAPYADLLQQRFPRNNIGRAALIFDALGAHGLRYQLDPNTPYLQISDDDSVLDSVQYPYELLQSKVGDCDDTTTLYCALLENLNIPTAALDVNDPEYGHIFMMFDSGIPIHEAGDFFVSDREYVIWEGRIWIPVETTLVGQSFSDAWRNGASEYYLRKERGYITEMLISDAQRIFPPGAVPEAVDIALPSQQQIDELFNRDLAFFDARLDQIALGSGVSLDSAEGLYDAGSTYLRLNQLDRALDMFNRAIEMDPRMADAHNAKGVVLTRQRNYPEALTFFNRALELNPSDAGYRVNIALTYHLQGRKDEAQRVYQEAVALNRDFADVFDFLGRASDAVRAAAPAVDPIQRAAAQKSYEDGAAFLRLNRMDRALEAFDRALALDPNHADAHNARGVIATRQRRYQEALNHFDNAVQHGPDNAGFYANRAIAYHLMGRKDEALREYARAVQLDEGYRGQLDAITGGQPLPQVGPPPAPTPITPIQKLAAERAYDDGAAFLRLNALDRAMEAFNRALSFDPNHAEAHNARGVIATRQRNYHDAIAHFDRALQNDSNNAGFHINMAIAYHLMGRKDDALNAYQRAIALDASYRGQIGVFEK